MSHVIQINDSAGEAKPEAIVLRLYPGEERNLELRIVNLGDPANVSLKVSEELARALRISKPNHYVVLEERVAVAVSMPEDGEMLEGAIMVKSGDASVRVPVALIFDDQEYSSDRPGSSDEDEEADETVDREEPSEAEDEGEDEPMVVVPRRKRHSYAQAPPAESPPLETSSYQNEASQDYDYEEEDPSEDRWNLYKVIFPASMVLALILLLVLTFYTQTIPEFPGALGSSILITTLIIYGAATLLKG